MASHDPLPVSTVSDYQRDGAVVLRGVLSAQQVERLKQGIEHNLAHLSPLAQVASPGDDPGKFVEDFCTWQSNPAYAEIMRDSALPAMAQALMQSEQVRIYHDHLLVKEPGTRQVTPWHQDQPYYNVSGRQNISFWIPVDPVPLESTLRMVAGSHAGTWYSRVPSATTRPSGFQMARWPSCLPSMPNRMSSNNWHGPCSPATLSPFTC
jgi:ectoine hydroxylase-related dioxygenase (phytanoyl-CoA dioxygenase family)